MEKLRNFRLILISIIMISFVVIGIFAYGSYIKSKDYDYKGIFVNNIRGDTYGYIYKAC